MTEPPIFAVSKYDGIVLAKDFFDHRVASRMLDGYKVVEPEMWVYSTIHIDEGSIARNHFASTGVVSPMYTTMRWTSSDNDPAFFELLLRSPLALARFRDSAQGTVNRRRSLAWSVFSNLRFPVPPIAEQRRIVDLISSVDSYIDALQRQADAARQARSAVLGEMLLAVGSDWSEVTLGEVAIINPKVHGLTKDSPFAPMDAVQVGERFVTYFESRGERSGARASSGDVLFARITPCLENGKVAQVPEGVGPCGGSTEFIVIRGGERVTSDFVYYWATSETTRTAAAGLMTGTTGRQRLSWQDLASLRLALPPISEQRRIVETIASIDEVVAQSQQAVSAARQLRSGLLSDLLSGKHEIPESYDRLLGAA